MTSYDLPPPPVPELAPGAAEGDPLAGLRDIHLPGPVPFWPPAPGWWMLAGVLVVLLAFLAFLEWRRRQTLRYIAHQELKAIASDAARYPDARAVAAAAALLMRRVLLTRAGRPDAAALVGADWERALREGRGGLPQEIGAFIAVAPYLPPDPPPRGAPDRASVVAGVRRWVRGNA